jgi:alpha-beta hydrolase superfamily lysophospholipase
MIAEPECGEIKGVIQILHGMCEYVERYTPMMEYFTSRGYVVAGHDHRGHGESVKNESDLGWFYDKTGKAIVEDAVAITEFLKKKYPGTRLTLFGHSMGSMVARVYLQKSDALIDGLILSGAPTKNPMAGVAVFLADCVSLFKGARHRSKLLKGLSIGAYEKKFQAEGKAAWLSVSKKNAERYLADPLCTYVFTSNGFRNLFLLLRNTFCKKDYQAQNPNLPIYFMAGGEDPVIVSVEAWRAAQEFLRQVGYVDVRSALYEGYRHELLNEDDPTPFLEGMLAFIEGERGSEAQLAGGAQTK